MDFGRSQTRRSLSGTCRWSGGGGGASLENGEKSLAEGYVLNIAPQMTMFGGTQVRTYAKSLSQMKEAGLKAYKPTTPRVPRSRHHGSIEVMERQTFESVDERVNEEWGEE